MYVLQIYVRTAFYFTIKTILSHSIDFYRIRVFLLYFSYFSLIFSLDSYERSHWCYAYTKYVHCFHIYDSVWLEVGQKQKLETKTFQVEFFIYMYIKIEKYMNVFWGKIQFCEMIHPSMEGMHFEPKKLNTYRWYLCNIYGCVTVTLDCSMSC